MRWRWSRPARSPSRCHLCGQQPPAQVALANPASVNCEKLGGRHVIRNLSSGQVGMCVFKDGRVCEEWALYRDDRCVGGGAPKRVAN